MRLFSYCIPIDDGAAPNPFWGYCTLAICKPKIRSVANPGDWVAGTGSRNVGGINFSGKLVYAMKIWKVLTMPEYEAWCKEQLPDKIPDIRHKDYRRRLGDSIYCFKSPHDKKPEMLKGVHNERDHRDHDINGKNVLISDHFYYFGDHAIELPEHLKPIIKQGQGHRSNANYPHVENFINWISGLTPGIHGEPQLDLEFDKNGKCSTSCRSVSNTKGIC